MASVFSKIIAGELPGRFAWSDDKCVVMATIEPTRHGHVMIVPRDEVDKYSDIDPDVFAHMMKVAQIVGSAQERAFDVPRAIVSILGFEVPHAHVHVVPATSEDVARLSQSTKASDTELDDAVTKLRNQLVLDGFAQYVPADMRSAVPNEESF